MNTYIVTIPGGPHITVEADYYVPNPNCVNFYSGQPSYTSFRGNETLNHTPDRLLASYYNVISVVRSDSVGTAALSGSIKIDHSAESERIIDRSDDNVRAVPDDTYQRKEDGTHVVTEYGKQLLKQAQTLSLKDSNGKIINQTKVTKKPVLSGYSVLVRDALNEADFRQITHPHLLDATEAQGAKGQTVRGIVDGKFQDAVLDRLLVSRVAVNNGELVNPKPSADAPVGVEPSKITYESVQQSIDTLYNEFRALIKTYYTKQTIVARIPLLPTGGDAGTHTVVTDPKSGISFLVSEYRTYRKVLVEISFIYGVAR